MNYRFLTEAERQLQLKLIASGYEENKGLTNTIELDIDGNYVRQNPLIDEDEDLYSIRESVAKLINSNRTNNILLIVNIFQSNKNKIDKCIMIHMCNPDEEHIYLATCNRKGSRKFLSAFEKLEFTHQTKGLFGDIFAMRKFAI